MSKHRIIGVADDSTAINFMSPSDFIDDKFDGIGLYQRRDKKPVVLFRSKSMNPQHWQVVDGMMDFHCPLIDMDASGLDKQPMFMATESSTYGYTTTSSVI